MTVDAKRYNWNWFILDIYWWLIIVFIWPVSSSKSRGNHQGANYKIDNWFGLAGIENIVKRKIRRSNIEDIVFLVKLLNQQIYTL